MGKGDVKSKKGKRWRGSYGVSRKNTTTKRRAARAKSKAAAGTKSKAKKGK